MANGKRLVYLQTRSKRTVFSALYRCIFEPSKNNIMSKEKGFCEVCGTEIEVTMCCSAFDCGCMGLPTEPPICSEKCYDKFMSQEYQDDKKAKSEFVFFKPKV